MGGPHRSVSWLDTVDQRCSAQIGEVATCGAQSVSRSRSRVMGSGQARPVALRASPEDSQNMWQDNAYFNSNRSRGLRRFERSGGYHVARIFEVRTSCSSGSAGCTTCTVRAVRDSYSKTVDSIRRGTSQIGVRVRRRSSTSAAVASRNCSRGPGSTPAAPAPPPDWAAGLLVTQLQEKKNSIGSSIWKRSCKTSGGRSTLCGTSGILVADRGSDTKMAVGA